MIRSVGFIGYGNMGSALAACLRRADGDCAIFVQEPDQEKAARAVSELNARVNLTPQQFCREADIIVIAVKPQLLANVLPRYTRYSSDKKIISIAAGVPINRFQSELSTIQVIRFMPNLAARVGKAITAVAVPDGVSSRFKEEALALAGSAGQAIELPENLLAAFTGLSGSGIAFVFDFLHALALGGTAEGIAYDTSLQIALATMEGAVELVQNSEEHPISLLSRVISPAGTTIRGVEALAEGRFSATVIDAVKRSGRRARELE